jgi:hypothetical protein
LLEVPQREQPRGRWHPCCSRLPGRGFSIPPSWLPDWSWWDYQQLSRQRRRAGLWQRTLRRRVLGKPG